MRTSFRRLTAGERAAFIGKYLFMGLCSLVALFPIVWVIMSSFKTNAEILSNGIGLPSSLSPDGYIAALTISPILKYFGNSVVITVITTVLNVLFLAMAAYVFARTRFRGKNLLYFILSLSLVVPTTALLQPVYSVVNSMGLYDTKMGLILVYTAINMPMSLLILRGTFQSIPRTLPLSLSYFTAQFSFNYTAMFAAVTIAVIPSILVFAIFQEQVVSSLTAGSVKG